jgi:poly(3-hydroxybutyrate) depolymerase
MRNISDITDKVPIGWFYGPNGKQIDVYPSKAFFDLFQPNLQQLSYSMIDFDGSLSQEDGAGTSTNLTRLHDKIDLLVLFLNLQMISWKTAGPFAEWDG